MKGIIESIMENRATTQADLDFERDRQKQGYTSLPEQYIEYGKVLTEAAGLICRKQNISDWIQTIDAWMECGYQPWQVEDAINAIHKDKNPILISRPGSITFKLDGMAALRRSNGHADGQRYVQGDYAEFVNR